MSFEIDTNFTFLPFSNSGVLFNDADQSILILNHSAALIWCLAFDLQTREELVSLYAERVAVDLRVAEKDIKIFFESVEKNKLKLPTEIQYGSFLSPVIQHQKFVKKSSYTTEIILNIDTIQLSFSVESDMLANEFSRIFNSFIIAPIEPSTLKSIQVVVNRVTSEIKDQENQFEVFVDKNCVANNLPFESVTPYLFGIVFEATFNAKVQSQHSPLMFHAAALTSETGNTILFPANSGSGKSTLSAALSTKGWQCHTDELAILNNFNLQISPHNIPLCIKDGSVPFLSDYYPTLKSTMRHHRLDEKWVRYIPIKNSPLTKERDTTIDAIVFPKYLANKPCLFEPIDKQNALKILLQCGSSGRPLKDDDIKSIVALVEQLPCYSLQYSDINDALTELNSIA